MIEDHKNKFDNVLITFILYLYLILFCKKVGKHDTSEDFEKIWGALFNLIHAQQIFLESFFGFKINHSRELDENLDIFNKLVQYITNFGEKVSNEYKAIILLNAIPDNYKEVKNAIKYGREILTSNIVIYSLKLRKGKWKLKEMSEKHERFPKWEVELSLEVEKSKKMLARKRWEVDLRHRERLRGENVLSCGKLGHFIRVPWRKKQVERSDGS